MSRSAGVIVLAPTLLLWLSGCQQPVRRSATEPTKESEQPALGREAFAALPRPVVIDPRWVQLGSKLFTDARLSSNNTQSCATCHDLRRGGDDGRVLSIGVRGQPGRVNAPTVYNAALNLALFWDGRAATLEEQVDGPLTSPLEMDTTWDQVIKKLRADPKSSGEFAAAFPDGVSAPNVRSALAAYQRTLITNDSAFDRFLSGDDAALDADQKVGYELFQSVGCVACHQGQNVGGNMYQRFGVLGDYFRDRGHVTEVDYGRFNVTNNESDRFVFRVPSLRNVAYTAPYFHDGSAETLPKAVQVMAKYQLGRSLTAAQVGHLVSFLGSLSAPSAAPDGGG